MIDVVATGNHVAQDLKRNVVTTVRHNASPYAKRSKDRIAKLDGRISKFRRVIATDIVRQQYCMVTNRKTVTIMKQNKDRGPI